MREDGQKNQALVKTAYEKWGGNVSAISRATGLHRRSVARHLRSLGLYGRRPDGHAAPRPARALPADGEVQRTLLTFALNDADVHAPTWRSLLALRDHWGADLIVRPGLYDVKQRPKEWAPEVRPYLCDHRVTIAPGIVFCGEIPISPTAVRPLSGLETYSGRASAIFAHPRVAMESVPAMRGEAAKFCYTTGSVTDPSTLSNSKAGWKARHHHVYGALLVEVDAGGSWWCRQLLADDDGVIQDLDVIAKGGRVRIGQRVEAIAYEPHGVQLSADAAAALPGILDHLRPRYQVLHDVLDFRARNHHEEKDPHRAFEKWAVEQEDVQEEIWETAGLLCRVARRGCQTVVTAGNHDAFFVRWLREANYRNDSTNAVYFLEAQLAVYRALARGEKLHVPEWALRRAECPKGVKFLREDDSFRVAGGRVEMGAHGHLGPNGARGSAANLSKLARRLVVGHSHTASIRDGVYVCGTFSRLDLPYTRGPSSWSHSMVVVYPSGKRAIVTLWNGRPWA